MAKAETISVAPIAKKKQWKQKSVHLVRDEEASPEREQETESEQAACSAAEQSQEQEAEETEIINETETTQSLSELRDMQKDFTCQPVSLTVPEMAMTVQSYRRSLQEFSESPVMSRCKSLSSSHSLTGVPQSITEWLVFWEKDPVEILLDLGFGTEEPDVCTKIPPRFLSGASVAKGINIRVFLEAQKQRMDIERPNLYERFRQLEVLDHVTSALSSLLTDINTQQTKAQDTDGDETGLLEAAKSRPVVTQVKRRRIGQLLKRASWQATLLKQGSLAPGETNLPSKKEQPCSCADIAESGTVQVGFSAHVTLGCLTQEQNPRDKGALVYPTSLCPPTPLGKAWASLHLVAKHPHLSPACQVPAKDRPRKEPSLLMVHTLKKVVDLNCKLPDSFEMEEIQSFEDETLCGNAPNSISAEVMVTRTSSCQSDSSGFTEELPEPVVLQNASLSGKINFISDVHDQERALSRRTVFPMLNQDFQQKPDDCVAKVFITPCERILTVPRSTKACSDQGEETHLLLTAENGKYQAYNAEPQTFVQEMLCDMDKKESKTGRKQLEKEECIKEHSPCFQGDTQDEGDPGSSKFDHDLYFSTEHKKVNVTFTELNDINPAAISESKIRGNDEGERCLTEKGLGVACHESAHQGRTECVKGPWWGVEVVSEDGTLLAVNEVINRQKFCKIDGDSKNTRCFPKMGLPETPQLGSAVQSGSSAASRCSLQVSQRHPSCLVEGPGLNSSEGQETSSIGEMLGANKSEQGDAVQNSEMASAPLNSVTVQMYSGLEFTSRVKCTKQNAPVSGSLAREDHVDFSDTLMHHSETRPLIWSDPGSLKGGVKQTTEASSQTDVHARNPRWPPVLDQPHSHLTRSASLDTVFCGKYRSHYWGEASGAGVVQGSHCCHCCCCRHGCCLWTFPLGVSPHPPVGCCSNHASTELQHLKTLMFLQDIAMCNLAPRTLHEIEEMKSSCQQFQEKLDEIEQHLTEQQVLFSSVMPDEGRKEGRHLQLLQQAVRQEVAELEFRLNDQACQVREGILMQLDQLLVEQSHLFSELGLSGWKGERKAQNKQVFPDAADTAHPQSGRSETVLQKASSKNTTATASLSALQSGAPPAQFPTRTTPEPNSAESDAQEFSTSKKEIKGPPQTKKDFKAFLHNLQKSFNSLGNDSAEGKD
ncbi:LOW QUALITY PROTEIN: protein ITPRID1 [Morus bassanus]